jgi:hypothetical protein
MRFMEAYLIKSKAAMVAGIIDDIRRVFYVLAEQSRKAEHETGLTGSQLWVVKLLDGGAPMMVGLLDRLEVKGLVLRTRSDKDRRVVHVSITGQGQELVRNSPEVAKKLLVRGLEPLSAKKVKVISEGMEQIVTILGVQEEPPQLIHSSDVNLPGKRRKSAA